MGNCQAIDAATLVVQHPNGKVEKMYWSVPASEIMKLNPGHYVALLITTTICHSSPKTDSKSPTKTNNNTSSSSNNNNNNSNTNSNSNTTNNNNSPKSSKNTQKNNSHNSQKNNSKGTESKNSSTGTGTGTGDGRNTVRITRVKLLRPTDTLALGHVYRLISTQEVMKGLVAKKQAKMRKNGIELADSEGLKEAEKIVKRSQQDKTHQGSRNGHRSRTTSAAASGATAKPKTWQPSLHSISEAAS